MANSDIDYIEQELELTTVGYINKKWATPPAGTHWANALARLESLRTAPTPTPEQFPAPTVAPAGWTLTFVDDFTTDCPLGAFPVYGVTNADTPQAVAAKWTSYPSAYQPTRVKQDPTVPAYYRSDKTLSIKDGKLLIDLHYDSTLGMYCCAAPIPKLFPSKTAKWDMATSTYGRFEICGKLASAGSTYKVAWLLYHLAGSSEPGAEIDYPEFNLDGVSQPKAFVHYAIDASKQTAVATNIDPTKTHVYAFEWSPGLVTVYLDGVKIGQATAGVPSQPMYWVIQSELVLGGLPLDKAARAQMEIDWVAFSTRNAPAPAPTPTPSTSAWPVSPWTAEPWHYDTPPTLVADPHSADYAANLLAQIQAHGAVIADVGYSIPVWSNQDSDPSIAVKAPNGDLASTNPWRMPTGVKPAPGTDQHAAVLDAKRRMEAGGYHTANGFVSADYGHAIGYDEINTGGTPGANDANLPHTAGILIPEHFTGQVKIQGALVFVCERGNGAIRWPSCKPGAHNTTDVYGPTNGMTFTFKPGTTYTGPAWKQTIFQAIKTYGMVCRDGSSNFTLFAEDIWTSGRQAPAYPWTGGYPSIADLPWSQLECVFTPTVALAYKRVAAKFTAHLA